MSTTSGVYPCYENQFQIDVSSSGTASFKTIADCESFSVSFDNGVEEWRPFEQEGWVRRLLTAKGVTISITAKRNLGDAGNDFVAGLAWKNGRDAEADFKWTFPNGDVVTFADAVIISGRRRARMSRLSNSRSRATESRPIRPRPEHDPEVRRNDGL